MVSIYDVALYVLNELGEITTMKLQKLLYYCQAWSLAWDAEELFQEDFQAWANGPVCPELYSKHRGKFKIDSSLLQEFGDVSKLNEKEKETIEAVLDFYKDKTPLWLSDLTHSERPWIEARKGLKPGESSQNIISKEVMQDYYAGL